MSKNIKIRKYKTINLPVDLYGCGTCSLTLREEHKQGVFENRVLRRIFGPKRDEVTGGWRKLHSEQMSRACSTIEGRRGMHIGYCWEIQKEGDH
jgi:hypothetical protein